MVAKSDEYSDMSRLLAAYRILPATFLEILADGAK
jgi:hypothetical protein